MNWKKLKNSKIAFLSILSLFCPGHSPAQQVENPVNLSATATYNQSADSITRMVLRHFPEQNPCNLNSYSATTYHRFIVKGIRESRSGSLVNDTIENTTNQNNGKYLFTSETLNFQKRLKPDLIQNENLSSKHDGKDDGTFALLATQLNDFSFFQPEFKVLQNSYILPFSLESVHKYDYLASDTIGPSGDALCKISFHPKIDQHFDGLSGMALINPENFAIRQINARSITRFPDDPFLVIDQTFEKMEGYWLPGEMKIRLIYQRIKSDNQYVKLAAESTNSNYQQQINPPLQPVDFEKSANQLPTDSSKIAINLIQKTKMIRFFAEGKIPMGYFNLDYNRIFGYNIFEGLKLGIGGETNRLLSTYFTVGGYISYGLKDKSLRHSEWVNFYPSKRSDLRIFLGYRDMNIELGEPEFLETKSLLNPESYRYLLIKNMFASKRYSIGMESRPFNDLSYYVFGDISENHSRLNTPFLIEHPFQPISLARTGLQLRYTPGIVLELEDGRHKEMNIAKSDYYLTIIQGHTILGGEYKYTKVEFKGKFNLPFSTLGTTTVVVRGGTMSQNSPIIEYFNSYGSFAGTYSLSAPYSFATMLLNEFVAANYTAVHLRHDFSLWLFPENSKKRPAFILAQNIGIGKLDEKYLTQYNLKDYRNGFYETGFEINNLLRMGYLSWGAGIYYRYGPYQFSSTHENFAYKFGFFFKL